MEVLNTFGNAIKGVYKKVEIWIFLFMFCWVAYNLVYTALIYKNTGRWPEGFVSSKEKLINDNKFSEITLPKYTDYDIEMAIPSGQVLHNTVQGNWGLSTDSYNKGPTLGIYRDGYSADGSIYKGLSGKKYKRMLEQGPYTLKYSFRKGQTGQDVKIFVNDSLVHDLKNEGITSDKFKVVGTNYSSFNNETNSTDRGRRKIDYIKFIPLTNQTKESFSNMNNVFNIEQFVVRENFTETSISKQMQEKNAERIEYYLQWIKNNEADEYENKEDFREDLKFEIEALLEDTWRGYEYAASPAFYQMHNDIANNISYDNIVDKYKMIIHDKNKKIDGKEGGTYYNLKLDNPAVPPAILEDLNDFEKPHKPEKIEKMMEKSMARIKSITFAPSDSMFDEDADEEMDFEDTKKKDVFDKPLYKQVTERENKKDKALNQEEQQAGDLIMPSNNKDNNNSNKGGFCPKNCVKTTMIDGNCDKDIIRMVVDGEDKFYRKCPYRCKNRFEKDYVNYDQSGPGHPYNVKRDGCRYSQAQCAKNCSQTLVEVDEQGRDINHLPNNYATINENSSKMYGKTETTGLFGLTDNRLGGSKTAYKTDYKPLNPNPKIGPVNYDAIWDFKA
tara:strand:+ start:511 stop:2352 length:1842 start_codon:yes stop_codon:yes gene_type:complete